MLSANKGIVSLNSRDELTHKNLSIDMPIWLLAQELVYAMEEGGIDACAQIICPMKGSVPDRIKALAYRLFTIADKKKWNDEAFAYNSLVVAWPEIQDKAAQIADEQTELSLFE